MLGKKTRMYCRRRIFRQRRMTWPERVLRQLPLRALASSEKTMDAPTRKRKVGKTRSVRVQPFQGEWSRGAKTWDQSPGSLTRIIKAMVMPRRRSTESTRGGPVMVRSVCSGVEAGRVGAIADHHLPQTDFALVRRLCRNSMEEAGV